MAVDTIDPHPMLKFGLTRLHLMLFAGLLGFSPCLASADVSITVAPPPIPEYDQPACPGDGYLWNPGYWAWGDDSDYYWVPGVWVEPPEVGFLWTPGWWGWGGGGYLWHTGFWGPQIGFYGGINYGFGYFGSGFWGGHWEGGHFFYNSACWHVGENVHNTYVNRSFVDAHNRAGFNGPGGIDRRPTAEEERAAHEGRREQTEEQRGHEREALHDRGQKFSENKGNPGKTALVKTNHAGERQGGENKGAENKGGENKGGAGQHGTAEHHGKNEHGNTEHQNAEHKSTGQHGNTGQHANTHHEGGHPSGGHPSGGHPSGGHPSGGHPSGGHPSGGHPSGGQHKGDGDKNKKK